MPVAYIERRRISRNKFIGFTPIGDRSVARRRIPRQTRFYPIRRSGGYLIPVLEWCPFAWMTGHDRDMSWS